MRSAQQPARSGSDPRPALRPREGASELSSETHGTEEGTVPTRREKLEKLQTSFLRTDQRTEVTGETNLKCVARQLQGSRGAAVRSLNRVSTDWPGGDGQPLHSAQPLPSPCEIKALTSKRGAAETDRTDGNAAPLGMGAAGSQTSTHTHRPQREELPWTRRQVHRPGVQEDIGPGRQGS